jgi:hypothetical protein
VPANSPSPERRKSMLKPGQKEHDTPLLYPDGDLQFVPMYKDRSRRVVLRNFWRTTVAI